ncbi:hypothetical protein GCM10025787_31860 [Saccharopolyspora rosea]
MRLRGGRFRAVPGSSAMTGRLRRAGAAVRVMPERRSFGRLGLPRWTSGALTVPQAGAVGIFG